jgi:hypothetical protein
MSRRLRLPLLVLAAVGVTATADAARGGTTHITVKPAAGSPETRFAVSFRAPERAGSVGFSRREYVIAATGPTRQGHCVSGASARVTKAAQGAPVRVRLNPRRAGGRWCAGMFAGTVRMLVTSVCPKGQVCPALLAVSKEIGKFSFRVRRPARAAR